jgi:hypothetical protein
VGSSAVVALIFSLGVSTWIFTKIQRQAGVGNAKSSLIMAGLCFGTLFLIVFMTLSTFMHHN